MKKKPKKKEPDAPRKAPGRLCVKSLRFRSFTRGAYHYFVPAGCVGLVTNFTVAKYPGSRDVITGLVIAWHIASVKREGKKAFTCKDAVEDSVSTDSVEFSSFYDDGYEQEYLEELASRKKAKAADEDEETIPF